MIHPKHYQELIESAIGPELIELNFESVSGTQLFFRYCPNPEHKNNGFLTAKWARRLADCEKSGGWWCEGIDPTTGEPMQWGRLKPDPKSPIAYDWKKGKQAKYKSPLGVPSRVTFLRVPLYLWEAIAQRYGVEIEPEYRELGPNGFWLWVLAHPELPVILTEGEKKAACLLTQGYIAIALPGIWMGRRVQKDSNGLKLSESLVPDLELFTQSGRTFYFCFDTDVKPQTLNDVRIATQLTAKLLIDKECSVKIITLPLLGDNKGAVDDFVVAEGIEAFNLLVEKADSFDYWQFKIEQQQRLTYTPFITVNVPDLSTLDINFPDTGIIVLDSAKGTGKSKTIEKNIKNNPVLLNGHRIFLMRDLCKKWGLDYREDLEKVKGFYIGSDGDSANRIGTCTESLLSIPIPENFTLVFDEVDQVFLSMLTSETCNKDGKRPVILAKFEEIIRKAQRIIIASADVSNKEVNYLKKIKGLETPIYLIKNEYISKGCPFKVFDSPTNKALIDHLLGAVLNLKKLWVTCDSIKLSQQLAALIKLHSPNTKILLVNSKTSGGDEQQTFINTLNNPETSTVDLYDVVITTQSMGTGVSDETGKFDAVYGFFGGVSTDSEIAQALARQRYPIPRYVWVAKIGKIRNTFSGRSSRKIKKDLITKFEANQLLLSQFNSNLKEYQWNWENNPHLDLYCQYVEQENRSLFNLRKRAINRFKFEGHQVEIVISGQISQEVSETLKQVREDIKQENYKLFKNARDIDKNEAQRLERSATLNPEDEAALQAFRLKQFYKVEALDDELLDFDKEGRSKVKVIRLELLQVGLSAATERDIRDIERQAKHGYGCFLPDLSMHSLGVKMLELSGIKDFLQPGVIYSNDDLQPLADFCQTHSKAMKLAIGLSIPEELPSNIWLFRKLCEQLGIKTAAKRQGRKQARSVWIDPENWEFLSQLVTRRQTDWDVVRSTENIVIQDTLQHDSPVIDEEPPKPIEEGELEPELEEALWLMETAAQYQDTETLEQMRGVYSRKILQETAKILKGKSMEAWLWVKDVIVTQNQLGFGSITG